MDGGFGQIGVDRQTHFAEKIGEGVSKARIVFLFLLDQFCQTFPDFMHFVFEESDGFFPFGDGWRMIAEEGFERLDELFGVG